MKNNEGKYSELINSFYIVATAVCFVQLVQYRGKTKRMHEKLSAC